MLYADKVSSPAKFNDVLKSDLYVLLKNYFDLNAEDIFLETQTENHSVLVKILAKAEGIKKMGGLPER